MTINGIEASESQEGINIFTFGDIQKRVNELADRFGWTHTTNEQHPDEFIVMKSENELRINGTSLLKRTDYMLHPDIRADSSRLSSSIILSGTIDESPCSIGVMEYVQRVSSREGEKQIIIELPRPYGRGFWKSTSCACPLSSFS